MAHWKYKDYQQMIGYLCRPGYAKGGRVGYKPGGLVEPGVAHYATEGTKAVREYLSTLSPGTKVQPSELANKYKINRKNLYTILEKEYPELKLLGRTEASKLVQKQRLEKRLKTPVEIPTVISKLRNPGKNLTRDYVDIRWPNDKIKEDYIEDFKQKRSGTKIGTAGLSNEQLAKKYFGEINNSTIATVERMNNVLQKQFDIKYKAGDPKEFVKKRKRRLDIVQGGKYIGGTEKNPFHHIMPIGGETPITTKDVTTISKQMNSKLAPYNKKLNDIADAISNHYTNRSPGFQKRIDELHKNAEQIINKVKKELPKKYQGLIGFTKLEPIYDEYGTILRLQGNRIGIDEKKSIAGVKGEAEEIGKMTDKRLSEFRKQTSNKKTPLSELMQRTGAGIDPVLMTKAVGQETGALLKSAAAKFPRTTGLLKALFETRTTLGAVGWAAEAPLLMLAGAYGRYANERDFRKALENKGVPPDKIDLLAEAYGQELADFGDVGLEDYAIVQKDTTPIKEEMLELNMSMPQYVESAGEEIQKYRDQQEKLQQLEQRRIREAWEDEIGRQNIGIAGIKLR